ncbi:MAG: cysteine desulfurase family protein, partial [bacterium]|nr:cysteine desulfurase family protein [bacterium]
MKRIYLDHAATTYLDPRVQEAMRPFWQKEFGNASSLYLEGRLAKQAIEDARKTCAKILNCLPEEIIFTGSGTESDNLAVIGTAYGIGKPLHAITTKIEHHAVLHSFNFLESIGWKVDYLSVDKYGLVTPEQVAKAIRPETALISIMFANNEVGTVEPIKEISSKLPGLASARPRAGKAQSSKLGKNKIYFHTDACQAAGFFNLDTQKLGVDLLTINGSKIYGPKGTGLLYIKKGTPLKPVIQGGGQEKGIRPGTENVAGTVGLSKALELAVEEREGEAKRLTILRDILIRGVLATIPGAILNGHPTLRLPNNANFCFPGVEGESLLLLLDKEGICGSTGSA